MAACLSSESQAMYKIKPFNDVASATNSLPNPPSMYPMKNYHEDSTDDELREPLQCLLQRQLAVLKELEKLNKEICEISPEKDEEPFLDSCEGKVSDSIPSSMKNNFTIVVKASPDDPPFSLVLLLKLCQQYGLTCSTVVHCHSSCTSAVPNYLQNFLGGSALCTDSSADLCLRIIWEKQILAPTLMVSVIHQSPIIGEVNILRYLCRLYLPHLYSKFGALQMANIDGWLDAALTLSSSKNEKSVIESFNNQLGKTRWLVGNSPSLADVYCSITVLKAGKNSKFFGNVEKWTHNCRNELAGFKYVEKMLKK